MTEKILVLPGDGIGPSVMDSFEKTIMMATDMEIIHGEIGRSAYESTGQYLPHDTLDLLDECKTVICGPTVTPDNEKRPITTLKIQLDLYSRVRWYRTLAPDLGRDGLEVYLWGSNNNVSNEFSEVPDLDGINLNKYIKNDAYFRMMTMALSDVEIKKIKNISCLTREDFFPISSSMFKDSFDSIFPADVYDTTHMNVKDWMSIVAKNKDIDRCIFCVDLYSHIVGSVLGSLTGYDHLSPALFKGDDYSLYQPCRRALLDDIEDGYANPTSAMMSACMLLDDLGRPEEARSVLDAVVDAYAHNERTPDVGGTLTTEGFTEAVINRI